MAQPRTATPRAKNPAKKAPGGARKAGSASGSPRAKAAAAANGAVTRTRKPAKTGATARAKAPERNKGVARPAAAKGTTAARSRRDPSTILKAAAEGLAAQEGRSPSPSSPVPTRPTPTARVVSSPTPGSGSNGDTGPSAGRYPRSDAGQSHREARWDLEEEAVAAAPALAPAVYSPSPPPPFQSSPPVIPPVGPHQGPTFAPDRRGRKGLVVGLLVGGLVLAGGGTGLALSMRDGHPSKSKYIAGADAICGPANAPAVAIVRPTSYPELATAAGTLATATSGQLGRLRGLDRPGGDSPALDAFLGAFDATGQASKRLQDAAVAKSDTATIAAANDLRTGFDSAKANAGAFGFRACGVGLQQGFDANLGGSQSVIKAGFVAKADDLCRAGALRLNDLPIPSGSGGQALARLIDQELGVTGKMLADLKAVPVPPGDEAVVAEMFAAQEQVEAKARDLRDAAAAENESKFAALDHEMTPLVTAGDAKFDAYDLGICGSNFGDF